MSQDQAAELLEHAYSEGTLSKESTQALLTAGEVSKEVGKALNTHRGDGELLLVTLLIDDTASISSIQGGPLAVCNGHNHCLDALDAEGKHSQVLVHTRFLGGGALAPYSALSTAVRLNVENYAPLARCTPLYKRSVITLGAVMAQVQAEKENGRVVRAFTLIISDGEDNASGKTTAEHVKFLTTDMLEFSDNFILAGMGIGSPTRFQPIFRSMGIPDQWILTADASPADIAALFRRLAKSLQLAASGAQGWLELEAGPPPDA